MSAAALRMGPAEWLMLAALSVLWGGSFFFVAVAVRDLPPFVIVTLRVGLAAVALNMALLVMGVRLPVGMRWWLAFLGMGLLNNVIPFTLIVWGQTHIASGLASILNATTPFFTIAVAHFLTPDEKLTPARLGGIIVAFCGVAIIIGPDALSGWRSDLLAQLAVLAATISYAFAGVFGRRFRAMGATPLITAAGQLTASTAFLIPLTLFVERPWSLPPPGWETAAAVAGLALLSTALAYILYFRILAAAGAGNLLLVTLLIPATAILLGAAVLREPLLYYHFMGAAVLAAGLAVVDGRLALAARRVRRLRAGSRSQLL